MFNPWLAFKGARAFWKIVRNPERLDEVFKLVDSVATDGPLEELLVLYRKDPVLAEALLTRPRLGPIDLEALEQLPPGTLGRAYAQFMRARGLDPSALPVRPAENEGDFVLAHSYETHDLWHVVAGFDTDVAGELGLQAFYLKQLPTHVPLAILLAGLAGTFLFHFEEREARMTQIARGWLLGHRARKSLFGTDWKTLWSQPLEALRASFGIDTLGTDAFLSSGVKPARLGSG